MNKTVMITGANTGIGKEVARQLALQNGIKKIYLACRNPFKADAAKKELESLTGKPVFEIIIMDMLDVGSIKKALVSLKAPIDALIMNAGGSGGKTPSALTKDGVTTIFATNVLGHVVLLEELIKTNKLKNVALFAGSEAARGIAKMGIKKPSLKTSSSDEFASIMDGKYFIENKFKLSQAYAQVKYIGAMWIASLARKNPKLKIVTMSPGGTKGTEGANAFPPFVQFLYNHILMPVVMPLLGLTHHSLETGAKRIVDGINNTSLQSGLFYGSKEKVLTGPILDQSSLFPDLKNETFQDNANAAIHRFI